MVRGSVVAVGLAIGLSVALAGCSWFSDDEPELAEPPEVEIERQPEIVQSVRRLEIGQTRDGIMLTAFGTGPGLGYGNPTLRPRRDGVPGPDGMLDFDFIATPPDPGFNLPQGSQQARSLRADLPLAVNALQGATGVRIHGRERGVQVRF